MQLLCRCHRIALASVISETFDDGALLLFLTADGTEDLLPWTRIPDLARLRGPTNRIKTRGVYSGRLHTVYGRGCWLLREAQREA